MAKKVDPLKAKEAKQKKIAIAGAVLLVLLLAFEVPKTMKKLHGNSGPDWRTAQPTAAPGTTATPPAGLAAPTLAGGNPAPVAATTTQEGPLSASETAPTAAVGQLASFGRFASKDPFASQAPTTGTTATSAPPAPPTPPTSTTSTGGQVPGSGGSVPGATPAAPTTVLTSAVIAVNGVQGTATVGSDFPATSDASQALFHLVSLTAHGAKVAIAGGSYANGAAAITLVEGKPVTLMNTADGTRYTLQLYPQGTVVAATSTTGAATTPAAPAAPSTGTTSTTTTTKSGG